MDKLTLRLQAALSQWQEEGNRRQLPHIGHEGKYIRAAGRRMLNLSSNDYLGLAATPWYAREDFWQGLSEEDRSLTSSSSRLLTGNFHVYEELEQWLADHYQKEAALVVGCGFHANTGILPALCDAHTLVVADKLVHASLIDGLRLAGCDFVRFPHQDYERLADILARKAGSYQTVFVVVESIYSMDGDRADLPRLVSLKKSYDNVLLYVDEAHGVGVEGPTGLGLAEAVGCVADIDLLVGTFGKALASSGAFVVCSRVVREYLVNAMRPFVFTTAQPPLCVAWTLYVCRHLAGMAERRQHLHLMARQLAGVCSPDGEDEPSQIVPYVAGSSRRAVALAEALQRRGFYVLPVRPPTVPRGTSRLRFSLTAALTDNEVRQFMVALQEAVEECPSE